MLLPVKRTSRSLDNTCTQSVAVVGLNVGAVGLIEVLVENYNAGPLNEDEIKMLVFSHLCCLRPAHQKLIESLLYFFVNLL